MSESKENGHDRSTILKENNEWQKLGVGLKLRGVLLFFASLGETYPRGCVSPRRRINGRTSNPSGRFAPMWTTECAGMARLPSTLLGAGMAGMFSATPLRSTVRPFDKLMAGKAHRSHFSRRAQQARHKSPSAGECSGNPKSIEPTDEAGER
jgi:hypothetical protein